MANSLEDILEKTDIDALPLNWQPQGNLKRFSNNKSLFSFQEKALESALKTLWLFFEEKKISDTL